MPPSQDSKKPSGFSFKSLRDLFVPLNTFINWSESRTVMLLAVVIGLMGGFGAVIFRRLIQWVQLVFFGPGDNLLDLAWGLPWWQRMIIPAIGGLCLAPLIKFFTKETKGHGVPEVMENLALRAGRIRPRTMVTRTLASAICIGSGGSVGREGPIIQIGAAIGSTVGQFMRATESRMRTLVGCGAAAGMAATFNAPLGGALFAVEVILGDFGLAQITPIIISSVSATAVSRVFLGNYPAFELHPYHLVSHWELLLYAGLGVCAGLLAWLFVTVLYRSEDFFESIRLPIWVKPSIGGLLIGVIAIWYPHIYGSGYEAMNLALRSEMTLKLLLFLIFIKLGATSITISSGGSGGIFAPSLFQGAMLGGLLGELVNILLPGATASSGAYALVGMGAMIAGTMQAPITVILVIFELTNDYTIILPVMTSCIISTLLAYKLLRGQSIYTRKLIRKGINIFRGRDLNVLRGLKVGDVMETQVAKVKDNTPLPQLIRIAMSEPHASFIQVDEKSRMTGLIPLQNILEAMGDENLREILVAEDVALHDYPVLRTDEPLDAVIRKLGDWGIEEVPVVDPDRPDLPAGMLRQANVLNAYRGAVIRQDLGTHVANGLVSAPAPKQVELLGGFRMVEIEAPRKFVGKTLQDLGISHQYGVQVFLIRKPPKTTGADSNGEEQMHFVPQGSDSIDPGDRLVLVGTEKNLQRIIRMT
ncbi:MAG: chloride channel protein [Candidatus Glassbacteria bacterium]|nr:chloride channel protein [Candidatus Glassbacteria bacterium]